MKAPRVKVNEVEIIVCADGWVTAHSADWQTTYQSEQLVEVDTEETEENQ